MDFISEDILLYCEKNSAPESELLQKLSRDTAAKILNPRMLSGHLQGRLLAFISKMLHPSSILEIGTYTGYSTLCLCEGLTADGKITTMDINDELEAFSSGFFKESPYHQQIISLSGDAKALLPEISGSFDLVFIDADKSDYCSYYDLVIEKVRSGGIILADNVLWSGHVLHAESRRDAETRELIRFNEMVAADLRVDVLMLPFRDGISIIQKK